MVRLYLGLDERPNSAWTIVSPRIVTSHLLVALGVSQPVQLSKPEPLLALAVRTTFVPSRYSALQVEPQLMPLGELVTVPWPVPSFSRTRGDFSIAANSAVTVVSPRMMTSHLVALGSASQPLQPSKTEPAPALAVKTTVVPSRYSCSACGQAVPQLMPAGELVTVPWPVPAFSTTRKNFSISLNSASTVNSSSS